MNASKSEVDTLVTAIQALILAAERFDTASAQQSGVGTSDVAVLHQLHASGHPVTPANLSRQLLLHPATLSSILDRLAAAAYLARVPNPDDGRSVLITLRPSGRRFVAVARRRMKDVASSVLEPPPGPLHLIPHLQQLTAGLNNQTDQRMTPGNHVTGTEPDPVSRTPDLRR